MSDIPLVSDIVPNCDHAKYLGKRIDSVLDQIHKNLEFILLDDASNDRSVEILSEYSRKYGLQNLMIMLIQN
jgi:glycosyltransferase involved in cell wall biosynthesis